MKRRWSMGTLTAIVVAIATAMTVVGGGADQTRWQFALSLSADGVEVSAATRRVRIALTL